MARIGCTKAAPETYLPLLRVIDECQDLKGNPRLTIGLTPVLVEQLAHEDFKRGLEDYLRDRIERARSDRNDFQRQGELHLVYLATRWETFYQALAERFANDPLCLEKLRELGREVSVGQRWLFLCPPCLREDMPNKNSPR